jgi:hypothetical protein
MFRSIALWERMVSLAPRRGFGWQDWEDWKEENLQGSLLQGGLDDLDTLLHGSLDLGSMMLDVWSDTREGSVPSWTPFGSL